MEIPVRERMMLHCAKCNTGTEHELKGGPTGRWMQCIECQTDSDHEYYVETDKPGEATHWGFGRSR